MRTTDLRTWNDRLRRLIAAFTGLEVDECANPASRIILDPAHAILLDRTPSGSMSAGRLMRRWEAWLNAKDIPAIGRPAWRLAEECLEELSGKLRWRQQGECGRIDSFSTPCAHVVPNLFSSVASLLATIHNETWRMLASGLAITLIHPLCDGNGRWSRMYFSRALWKAGVSAERLQSGLQSFCREGHASDAYSAAQHGEPEQFIAFWQRHLQR